MRRLLAVLARALHGARCPSGCYSVKDGWVCRCDICKHIC